VGRAALEIVSLGVPLVLGPNGLIQHPALAEPVLDSGCACFSSGIHYPTQGRHRHQSPWGLQAIRQLPAHLASVNPNPHGLGIQKAFL
jgi:hypothetical protein